MDKNWDAEEKKKVEASVDPTAIDGSSQCRGLHQMSVCLSFSVSLTQGGAVVAEALGPWLPMTECSGTVILDCIETCQFNASADTAVLCEHERVVR